MNLGCNAITSCRHIFCESLDSNAARFSSGGHFKCHSSDLFFPDLGSCLAREPVQIRRCDLDADAWLQVEIGWRYFALQWVRTADCCEALRVQDQTGVKYTVTPLVGEFLDAPVVGVVPGLADGFVGVGVAQFPQPVLEVPSILEVRVLEVVRWGRPYRTRSSARFLMRRLSVSYQYSAMTSSVS